METLSAKQLVAKGRDVVAPFQLSLRGVQTSLLASEYSELPSERLEIVQCLRLVPGVRLVALAKGDANTAPFIAKLFFHSKNHKRHLKRDRQGSLRLKNFGIRTPELLFEAVFEEENISVLAFSFLKEGIGFGTALELQKTQSERLAMLKLSVGSIADCHNCGLWQRDIHPDNFMLSNGEIYTLDGADIQQEDSGSEGLDFSVSLENLTLFFAQFGVSSDKDIEELYVFYQSKRSQSFSDYPQEDLLNKVREMRLKRIAAYEKKLFRATTAHELVNSAGRFIVHDRGISGSALNQFLESPDGYIENGEYLKNGRSSTVSRIIIDDKSYILKRYNSLGLWHSIKRSITTSRARKSWQNAAVLSMLGIPTSRPFLMMELVQSRIIRPTSYFLCEALSGETVLQKIENSGFDQVLTEEIFAKFRELFQHFYDYRISHGDFKATNFLFEDGELKVIDLDGMKRHSSYGRFLKYHEKDKQRFLKNWVGTPVEAVARKIIE